MGAELSKNPLLVAGTTIACAGAAYYIFSSDETLPAQDQKAPESNTYSNGGASQKPRAQTSDTVSLGRFQVPASILDGKKDLVVSKLRLKSKEVCMPVAPYKEKMIIGTTPTLKVYASPSRRVSKTAVIMYVHGGQFVSGSAAAYTDVLMQFSNETKLPVYGCDYSLCPEKSLQQALKDVISVYKSLRRNYLVHVAADECGANLALQLLRKLEGETLQPTSVSLFNAIKSYSSEPLKSFAEKCLSDKPEELKALEVGGVKTDRCFVASELTPEEISRASKLIVQSTTSK
jgi:acetyl esterase/lipase